MKFNPATQAQIDAAHPGQSTWLSANAGSGKTRVLTDRVARLLLEGVSPQNILCLTYTKAAASEMQNRLFQRLGRWAMLEADGLRDELAQLGLSGRPEAGFLAEARTLFARAIEAPGGLRIQTIHSFCASLLRRFPLEAGVSPHFTEMDDRAGERLRADLLDHLSETEPDLVAGIAPFVSGDDTQALMRDVIGQKAGFAAMTDAAAIRAAYGLAPQDSMDALLATVFLGGELEVLHEMLPALDQSGKTDQTFAARIRALTGPDLDSLLILEEALLGGAKTKTPFAAKIGKLPTKGLLKTHPMPHLMPRLDDLMRRVEAARDRRIALMAADRDTALWRFARAFLPAYDAAKQARGWLDFDDLVTRARDLLNTPAVAEWVLYRLDGGIDHILVDEAQDTSPVQWQVIERLAQEITAGQGARDLRRTIFVVGDKKQSIYSFQGADPSEFDRMRGEFDTRLKPSDAPLNARELQYSFRSAVPVLRTVDEVFHGAEASGFVGAKHIAFKELMPGRVDLWPVVPKPDKDEDRPWFAPVDSPGRQNEEVVLARRIAHFVRGLIDGGARLPAGEGGRPVTAGDVLVLVRRRKRLFQEIIRACKQEGIPIAGADRLRVMAELAVRDIVAVLRFLSVPEDDLSLACALRSPLFGLSERELFHLAHGRGKGRYLWAVLRERRADHAATMAVLDDLRGQTDFLRPFDLIERLLTRHQGRQRLIGRLGPEAEDGIDALLQQALAYEQSEVPSLTGFLEWVDSNNLEIKRAAEGAGAMLRVMTVHGAKGLEAPIVILPDCGAMRPGVRGNVVTDDAGVMWKQPADSQPARQRDALGLAEAKAAQERDRLLYVGMTRAENWLVVAAAGKVEEGDNSWYTQVASGLSGAVPHAFAFGPHGQGEGLRLDHLSFDALPLTQAAAPHRPEAPALPDWAATPAPKPEPMPATRAPSDLGGAKALPGAEGDSEEVAMARGSALHLLLETLAPLPAAARPEAGARLCPDPALVTEALAVLSAPALAPFWAKGSLAEVPVTADLPGLGRIHGVIDRLVITPDRIIAADFKSNRTVPDSPDRVPEGLLRQMGAYAAALAQIYPGLAVETGLIWTATATYMPLPHESVTQALAAAATS